MAQVLLVLVAHSGRTLQLDVQPSTRVDAVQHALVSFTGIPVADQIPIYQGARLDPAKLLGAYRLPVDPSAANAEDHPVFLYCRSYLKPGAALPPLEALSPLQVQVPPLAEVNLAHPLHSAPSPLVRALPDYERHFQHHLATTRAYWEVAQARLQRCRQLLSEQEVQARAADAARANVEAHYNYILNNYQSFLDKYNSQHAAHALLLSTFPADLAALEAIELHPALQEQPAQPSSATATQAAEDQAPQHQHPQQQQQRAAAAAGAGRRRLADLLPVQRLRDWAETCARSHARFSAKVAELEALFQLLRKDVEGLFMQAPSVDLDALGRQMTENEALLDEHSSMVQVLSKDLRTVRTLVEDVVRQLGSAGPGGGAAGPQGGGLRQGALQDAAAAMEAIHETHRNRVLPRLAQLDGQLATFAAAVEASKVAMSRDVLGQLQRISGQQSRIRDMKNQLAAFHEVLGRQDAAFAELKVVHRLPSAYRALLAEVVRRNAWHQLYCGQAGRLAEHMSRFRDKEAGRRAAFTAQVSRYLPPDLLPRAGLSSEPPHCQVTVPPPDAPLISVAISDLQRLSYLDERLLAASSATLRASSSSVSPAAHAGSSASASHHHHHHQQPGQQRAPDGSVRAPAGPVASYHHGHHQQQHRAAGALTREMSMGAPGAGGGAPSSSMLFPGTTAVLDADPPPPTNPVTALEMENARLRAELANHIADACMRELERSPAAAPSRPAEASPSSQQQQQQPAQLPSSAADAAASLQGPQGAAGRRASGGGASAAAAAPSSGSPQPAAAQGSLAASSRRDPAELVVAMHRALGMKDDLIRQQQREASALAARLAVYEDRIKALEGLLDQRALAGGAAVAAAVAAGGADRERVGEVGGSSDGAGQGSGRESAMTESERMQQGQGTAEEQGAVSGLAAAAAEEEEDSGRLAAGQERSGGVVEGEAGVPQPQAKEAGARPGGVEATAVEPEGKHDTSGVQNAVPASSSSSLVGAEGEATASATGGAPPHGVGGVTGAVGSAGAEGLSRDDEDGSRASPAGPSLTVVLPAASPLEEKEDVARVQLSPPALSPFSMEAAQHQRVLSTGDHEVAAAAGVPAAPITVPSMFAAAVVPAAGNVEGFLDPGLAASSRLQADGAITPAQPMRGSSGPQAIPQPIAGSLRRGGGGGSGGNGERRPDAASGQGRDGILLPYESRMPAMSIGSLPFATSLPVGSALAGRLASSPSAGIGLGLALGFGLTSLAEAQQGQGHMQQQGQQQQRQHRRGSPLPVHEGSSGDGTGSGRSGEGHSSDDVRGEDERRPASEQGEVGAGRGSVRSGQYGESRGDGNGGRGDEQEEGPGSKSSGSSARSSLSGSSGGLQFQPSWSAPVSGDSLAGPAEDAGLPPPRRRRASTTSGAAGGPDELEGADEEEGEGEGEAPAVQVEAGGHDASGAAAPVAGDDADTGAAGQGGESAGGSFFGVQGVASGGASDAGGRETSLVEAAAEEEEVGVSGDTASAASGEAQSTPARDAALDDEEGNGHEDEDEDDEDIAVEELPDIDDVIEDSDGAWEVTSTLRGAQDAAAGGPGAAAGSEAVLSAVVVQDVASAGTALTAVEGPGQGSGVLAERSQDGSQDSPSEQGELQQVLAQQGAQLLTETSSGYESVGSVESGSGAGL